MAKGRIEKGDIVADGILKDFNKELETTTKNVDLFKLSLKAVEETGKKLKKGFSTVKPKDVKSIQEFNALTVQSNANAKNRLAIDKSLLTEKAKLARLRSEQNKAIKTEIALGDKQINTLEKLRARNAAIKIAKDKVNFSTKKGQQAIKNLNAQLDRNNKILEKNASKLGKQKIGIGRYSKAISGLRSGLVQLGLGMGVFQILKNSFNIVKDFEQGQANLAAVLGVNVDQMKALTDQAKELGATTTFTASQVAELQKEYAKLGFSMSEIENVTEATLLLAEATGTDLGRAAEVTGATIRGFGLAATDTQRVVDVMAKSFSSSSLDMEKFATAMSAVAPVAKNAGFSIEQTTALLGTLTDRGIDASSAGTGLRNMFLDAKKNGLSFNEALEQVNGASDKTAESFKLFGKRGATLGVILAENGEAVESLKDKLLDSDDAAKKMAETQRATLGGAIKLLTSAWEGFILRMNEAGGAGDKLRKVIVFLADNFESIVFWVGMGIKAFVGFKLAMKAMKLSEFVTKLGGVGSAFKEIGKGAKSSVKGIQGMGKAMKGIGLGLAISALLELAVAFYDIASGAAEARRQQDLFNESTKNSSAEAKRFNETIDAQIEAERKRMELLVLSNDLTQEAMDIELKRLQLQKQSQAAGVVEDAENRIIAIREESKALKEKAVLDREAIKNNTSLRGFEKTEQLTNLNNKLNRELRNNSDIIRAQRTVVLAFGAIVSDTSDKIHDYTVNIADNSGALKKGGANMKEFADETIGATNELFLFGEEMRKLEERLHGEALDNRLKDLDTPDPLNEIVDIEPEQIEGMEEKKFSIQKEYIDLLTNYFIENADKRIAKIDEEIDAATKQADHFRTLAENGNILAKESLAEQNRLIAEANIKKEQEEKRKQRIQMASNILKAFNAELQVEGTTSGEAFAKAITSTTLLTQFIGALPTFLEGTEDTGANGRGIDGKGGFNAVLHPNERVMTKEQNAMIGGVSNDYVAQVMEQHRVGNYMDGGLLVAQLDNAELVNGLSSLQSEMSEVKKAILNKPVESNNTAEMLSNYMMFEKKVSQGGKTTTSRFKVQ